MRIYLKIKTGKTIIPFDYQHLLVGSIHKWLGWNDVHGSISMFSFSWLNGGKATKEDVKFSSSAFFFISSHEIDFIKKLISGIKEDPSLFHGLTVQEIIIEEDPDLSEKEFFQVASPIFIKRRANDRIEHISYEDNRSGEYLKETLQTKMKIAGIMDDTLDVRFDLSYTQRATKLVTYKGVKNKVNWCPVIIKGKPETKLFAWNVGLGNSTGIGYGAIK